MPAGWGDDRKTLRPPNRPSVILSAVGIDLHYRAGYVIARDFQLIPYERARLQADLETVATRYSGNPPDRLVKGPHRTVPSIDAQ